MLTLNQIVSQITNLASAHNQIAESGVGDFAEWQAKERNYPILWVFHESTSVNQMEIAFSIRLICADRVIVGEEGDNTEGHEQEVISDTLLVLLDFLAYFQQNHSQPYNVVTSATIDPFTERLNDRLAGNSVTIQIRQPFDWNKCQIPQTGASIPPSVDGLTLYNFCDAAVSARLTDEQIACIQSAFPTPCPDATYTLEDTDGNTLSTGSIPSGGSTEIVAPDGTVLRDGQPFGSVLSGGTIDVPSDCGSSVSVTVTLSDDTPRMDDVVTVTASATGITATSYTFYLPKCQGYEAITQASPTLNWPVRVYGAFEVVVTATDGAIEGVGSVNGTTSGDVNADAFIAAHETATGLTMNNVQRAAVLNACLGLKGSGLAGYTDYLWDGLSSAGASWAIYCPVSDSVANASAYSIELFDPSTLLTLVGFVPADITVNGMIGGTGKYLKMGVAPDQYPQDNAFAMVYNRTQSPPANAAMYGSCSLQADVFGINNNASVITTAFSNRLAAGLNGGRLNNVAYAVTPSINRQAGINAVTRTSSLSQQAWTDTGIRSQTAGNTDEWSYTPSDREYYVHAANGSAGEHRATTAQLCGFMCGPCDNLRAFDQIKAVFTRFQQEVITGGRHV